MMRRARVTDGCGCRRERHRSFRQPIRLASFTWTPSGKRSTTDRNACTSRWRHVSAGCAYDLGRRHAEEAEERLRDRVRELTARVKQLERR